MANERLLVVDADARTLRVLEVSLRTSGYRVTTAADGGEALAQIESSAPDLVISDTALAQVDGFALVRKLKERPQWATIPVMLLTSPNSTEDRIRALELGVDDCVTKPVFVREVVARVRLLLDRRMLEKLAAGRPPTTGRFTGTTRDIGVESLLQTFELSRFAGVLHLQSGPDQGSIFFREGQLVDAKLGPLCGEEAVYRALAKSEWTFEIESGPVANEDVIGRSTEALVLEGMRRASPTQIDESAPSTQDEDVLTAVTERNSAGMRDGGRVLHSGPPQEQPTHALGQSPPAPAVGKDKDISNAGSEEIHVNKAPTLVREESRTKEVDLDQWLEEPSAQTSAESSLEHERIAGVPRQIKPSTKRIVAAVLAGSAVILVAGSLRVLRARQERLAEASRTPVASALVATATPIDVPPPPPTEPTMASAQGAESDSAIPSIAPIGEVPESSANPMASTARTVADVPPVVAMPATAVGVAMSRAVVGAPPTPPERETPINGKGEPGGGSLLVQASHALAEGATAHAIDLGRQATAANPGDADAWLTLAAAYQASGNGGAAHGAYASCVAQARTPDVSECRVLAGQRSP
ncbi:MAG: response regulator [Polyangiaceae bacterium]